MIKVKSLFCISLTFFVITGLSACTKKQGSVRPITPQETMGQLVNDFAVLVDVREREEVEETGIAEKARWIPYSSAKAKDKKWDEFVKSLPKDKLVVLYCAGGVRSEEVGKTLSQQGFQAANLGGFSDWKKAGFPVRDL